jgi:hypothetical protein
MSIPLSGIILIPLSLAIFFFAPHRLGQFAIVAAVFAAASVLNFAGGSFPLGIAPYYFVAILIAVRLLPKWLKDGVTFSANQPLVVYLRIVLAFVGWSVVSAFLLPLVFHGLPVDLGRAGPDATFYSRLPLQWSLSNCGQAGYLSLDAIVIIYLIEETRTSPDLGALAAAFSLSGLIVIAVGAYQYIAHHFGLPFPSIFLNSNPAWAQLTSQDLNGTSRISATFDESSGAGSFLAAWTVFQLTLATRSGNHRWRHLLYTLAGLTIVIGTTSTTGYLTTAVMLMVMLARELIASDRRHHSAHAIATLSLIALAIVCVFLLTNEGYSLLSNVLLDKARSGSSLHRMATVRRSFDIFTATYGLGAGLGSNRAMSMVAYILSNLGALGVMLFVWLMLALVTMSRVAMNAVQVETAVYIWHQAFSMAFIAHLLALTLSGAEISDPTLWLLWGTLLASLGLRWPVPYLRQSMPQGSDTQRPTLINGNGGSVESVSIQTAANYH